MKGNMKGEPGFLGRRKCIDLPQGPEVGKYRLLTANLNGSDEQILIISPYAADTAGKI